MLRKTPFENNETYHVYNRGAHKQPIFLDAPDYRRFQLLLLIANSITPVHLSNTQYHYQGPSLIKIYDEVVIQKKLVNIIGYVLMPNHFHIVLKQEMENGITTFMKKLCTAYSMYFNIKHEHSGTVFQGRFKSKHINSAAYLRWLMAYIHLNPVGLKQKNWEQGVRADVETKKFLSNYSFSSLPDFNNSTRPERAILADRASLPFESGEIKEFADFHALIKIVNDQHPDKIINTQLSIKDRP